MLKKLIKVDSNRNCQISDFFSEPKVLRIPTSFALSTERAVDRLMKFIQAIARIKAAITLNI